MAWTDRSAQFIDRLLLRLARWLAPAMPWIHLLLRRAAVVTLFWVAALVLFMLVPQSREVLRGLVLTSRTGGPDPIALACYLVSSLLMASGLWYAARLLVTVDADAATPTAWRAGINLLRLQQATTWLPRLLGASAMAVAMGAMMFALLTPPVARHASLAAVVLALAGPLLLAHIRWAGPARPPAQRTLGSVVGVLMWLAASAWAGFHLPDRRWAVLALWAVVAWLPAVLLVFMVQRRKLLARASPRQGHEAAHDSRDFIQAMRTGLGAGLAVLAGMVGSQFVPGEWFRHIGSAAVLMLFLAMGAQLLAGGQLIARHLGGGAGGLSTALVALLVLALVLGPGSEPLGTESLPQAALPGAAPAAAPPAPGAEPATVVVNARGGGLRAAAFTAEVLARADDRSCGQFGARVRAFSGVSGGSVGIATYLLARQAVVARGGWPQPCSGPAATTEGRLTRVVRLALLQDHLSPVLGRMATSDLLPLTPPRRGQALLESWQGALAAALDAGLADMPAPPPGTDISFALPLDQLHGGLPAGVLVFFNATDADSGDIVWFSNQPGRTMGRHVPADAAPAAMRLQVGQAVLHSARFPIVSPAGRVDGGPGCRIVDAAGGSGSAPPQAGAGRHCRLVDGGYADNSGAITLRRIALHRDADFYLDLDGNPPAADPTGPRRASPVPTGLGALLAARGAHADLASSERAAKAGATAGPAPQTPEPGQARPNPLSLQLALKPGSADAVTAPLGWYMSDAAAGNLSTAVQDAVQRLCQDPRQVCAVR